MVVRRKGRDCRCLALSCFGGKDVMRSRWPIGDQGNCDSGRSGRPSPSLSRLHTQSSTRTQWHSGSEQQWCSSRERKGPGDRLGGEQSGEPGCSIPFLSAHPPLPIDYPTGPHVSFEAAQFVVCNAPGHHYLRAIIVLFVAVLGQGHDGILGVEQLHVHEQGVGHLVVEALQG